MTKREISLPKGVSEHFRELYLKTRLLVQSSGLPYKKKQFSDLKPKDVELVPDGIEFVFDKENRGVDDIYWYEEHKIVLSHSNHEGLENIEYIANVGMRKEYLDRSDLANTVRMMVADEGDYANCNIRKATGNDGMQGYTIVCFKVSGLIMNANLKKAGQLIGDIDRTISRALKIGYYKK